MIYNIIETKKTLYVPVICGTTGKSFYYQYDYSTYQGSAAPTWFMVKVHTALPVGAQVNAMDTVDLVGHVKFTDYKCPFCGKIGYSRHTPCGTVVCSVFDSAVSYCPKCKAKFDLSGEKMENVAGHTID